MELLYKKLQSRRIVSVAVLIAALALPAAIVIAHFDKAEPFCVPHFVSHNRDVRDSSIRFK